MVALCCSRMDWKEILRGSEGQAIAQLDEASGDLREALDAAAEKTLGGNGGEVRDYVVAYRALIEKIVATAPGHAAGARRVIDPFFLKREAIYAPFSRAAQQHGVGRAALLATVARIYECERRYPELFEYVSPLEISSEVLVRYERQVDMAFDFEEPDLEMILGTFELTNTAAGRVFGVSREAIRKWRESGVPTDRQEKVATVAAIADILRHRLKRDRIAGIVRKRASAYGGRNMLEMISADRHDELHRKVRDSFDFTATG